MSFRFHLALLLLPFALALSSMAAQPRPASQPRQSPHPTFTVLGRWAEPMQLTYRIEREGVPFRLGEKQYLKLLDEALAAWQAHGRVAFREALPVEVPNITFGWREGEHDDCPPFIGWCGTLAHTGPIGESTFVHFNRATAWSAKGPEFNSFYATALHEIGHVLGLDHSAEPKALMHSVPDSGKNHITKFEWLGLESLYGSAAEHTAGAGDGDAQWFRFDRKGRPQPLGYPVLRVAPSDRLDMTLLDINGALPPELVTWPKDPNDRTSGLSFFSFNEKGLLCRSIGPAFALTFPENDILFDYLEDGTPTMIHVLPDRRFRAVSIPKKGLPVKVIPPKQRIRLRNGLRDDDGDAVLDNWPLAPARPPEEALAELKRRAQLEPQWQWVGSGRVNGDDVEDILIRTDSVATNDTKSDDADDGSITKALSRYRWLLSDTSAPVKEDGASAATAEVSWRESEVFEGSEVLLFDMDEDGFVEALIVR